MKKLLVSLMFLVALMVMPAISGAVPGNGNGDGNAGGNGNHYGWDKGDDRTYATPEPSTLLQLGSGLVAFAGWAIIRKRARFGK
jgi:hypothetical protein